MLCCSKLSFSYTRNRWNKAMHRSWTIKIISVFAILIASSGVSFADVQKSETSNKASRVSVASCDEAEIDVATTPVPPQRGVSLKYYRELKEIIPKSTEILLIGDSIFQFWPQAEINKFTGGKNSFKFAVGSDRTQSILWRLQDTNLQPLNPKRVVLLLGTNNLGDSAPACAVLVATKQILDRIYKMWPDVSVTIVEVLPREEGFAGRQEQRLSLNAQLRTLKDVYPRLTTVNVDHQMSCGIVPDPLQPSAKATSEMKDVQCGNYLPDLVHPAPPGYEVLGAALQPFFIDQGK